MQTSHWFVSFKLPCLSSIAFRLITGAAANDSIISIGMTKQRVEIYFGKDNWISKAYFVICTHLFGNYTDTSSAFNTSALMNVNLSFFKKLVRSTTCIRRRNSKSFNFSHFTSNDTGRKLSGTTSPSDIWNRVVRWNLSTLSLKKITTQLNEAKIWFFENRILAVEIHKRYCTCNFVWTSLLNLLHVWSCCSTQISIPKSSQRVKRKTNGENLSLFLYWKQHFFLDGLRSQTAVICWESYKIDQWQ